MPVSENSIKALQNPETIAKSIATRQRNKANRLALKQKLAYDKLEKSSDGLLTQIRNQIGEDTATSTKLANLEYSTKTQEGKIDNIKNQLDINTQAISVMSKISPVVHNLQPPSNTPLEDRDCREKVKELKNRMKENTKTIQSALTDLDDKVEQNDTEIADLYTRISNIQTPKGNAKEQNDKINLLFRLLYQALPKSDYMNNLCPSFNTEVSIPAEPPPQQSSQGFFNSGVGVRSRVR